MSFLPALDRLDPLLTSAAFDAVLEPKLLVLLDAVRAELARLMDDVPGTSQDGGEERAQIVHPLRVLSEHLDELRETLAQALRQRRDGTVRADLKARPWVEFGPLVT